MINASMQLYDINNPSEVVEANQLRVNIVTLMVTLVMWHDVPEAAIPSTKYFVSTVQGPTFSIKGWPIRYRLYDGSPNNVTDWMVSHIEKSPFDLPFPAHAGWELSKHPDSYGATFRFSFEFGWHPTISLPLQNVMVDVPVTYDTFRYAFSFLKN